MQLRNPIIPGFYPDPSVCKSEAGYFMVTSTFEYFPGVPLFHSQDMVNWTQIGHVLSRSSQLDLSQIGSSMGIFAPCIRYHQGTYYMVTTVVGGAGHFIVTTDDPFGEWSDPIFVDGPGFDPDLFFDDGRCYFLREDISGHGIRMWEIDIASGKLLGDEHLIWEGLEDRLCEAPHIYKIGDYYHLIVAEGGTHRGHMVVSARSKQVTGPYESCPHNPILTHRHEVLSPIQAAGHGELVQGEDGRWWMYFLGIRQLDKWHHLGRETFMAPVHFEDNWPVVNQHQPIALQSEVELYAEQDITPVEHRIDLTREQSLLLNTRGNWDSHAIQWCEGQGLSLSCAPSNLEAAKPASFVGMRQQHFNCEFATEFSFSPEAEEEEAGICVLMNEKHFYSLALRKHGDTNLLCLRKVIGDVVQEEQRVVDTASHWQLSAVASAKSYQLICRSKHGDVVFEGLPTRLLSSEVAGGFTGVYFGIFASANGQHSDNRAVFSSIHYRELEAEAIADGYWNGVAE